MPRLRPDQLDDVDRWLRSVLWDNVLPGTVGPGDFEIHRSKGRIVLQNGDVKIMQGVREVFELIDAPDDSAQEAQGLDGKIIFIGRRVADVDFQGSFRREVQ